MPRRRKSKMSARLMFKGLHTVKYLAGGKAISLKQIVPNPFQPTKNRSTPEKIGDLYDTIINSRYMSAIEVVEIPNTTEAREAWEMTLEEYRRFSPHFDDQMDLYAEERFKDTYFFTFKDKQNFESQKKIPLKHLKKK